MDIATSLLLSNIGRDWALATRNTPTAVRFVSNLVLWLLINLGLHEWPVPLDFLESQH